MSGGDTGPERDGPTASPPRSVYAPDVHDVMVVGVGGQGVILAAAVISDAALRHGGLQVKLSETRGMSQRGGSVRTHIRIGEHVVAPTIAPGEADYLLAFEASEGLRYAPSLAPGGVAIVSTQQIVPPLAAQGDQEYPFDALARLRRRGFEVVEVPAEAVARETGDVKVAGMVLVGALAARLPLAEQAWQAALHANVPPKWFEMNEAAFAAGRSIGAGGAAAKDAAMGGAP